MDLENKRQETMSENYDIETSETFEFEFDSNMNMINTPPSSDTPVQNETPSVQPESESVSADDIAEIENKKRVPTESLEMNFDGTDETPEVKAEVVDDGFKFDDGVSDEPEVAEPEVAELDDLQKALKRIDELENNQNKAMSDAEFENTYSKDTEVMPKVSEYEYATLGKELGEKGALSEETYANLLEKGYSKAVVDNHITQTLAQIEGQPQAAPVAEIPEEVARVNFAKELGMESSALETLVADAESVFTPAQFERFNNSSQQEKANTLLKFQNQKLLHAQKVAGKRLIKGSNVKPNVKNSNDNISTEDAQAAFTKAIMASEYGVADKWGKLLESRGVSSSF